MALKEYQFIFYSSEYRCPELVNIGESGWPEVVAWSSGTQIPSITFFQSQDVTPISNSSHHVINLAYRKKEDMPFFLKVCPHWPIFSYIISHALLPLSRSIVFSSLSALCLGRLCGPHWWEVVTSGFYGSSSGSRGSSRRLEKQMSEIRIFIPLDLSLQGFIGQALSLEWGLLISENDWFYLPLSFSRLC